MRKLSAIERLAMSDYQRGKLARAATVELLAQGCASGASHNDTSKLTKLLEIQNSRTRMGRALIAKLPILSKALNDVYAAQPNHLPPLPITREILRVNSENRY